MAGNRYLKLAEHAREHHRAKQYPQAEKVYRQALAGMPNDVPTLHALGVLLRQMNRPGEAADVLEKAVRLQPRKAALYNDYGLVLTQAGRPEEAIKMADQAIRAIPKSPIGYFQKAQGLLRLSRTREAIQTLEKGVISAGRDPFLVRLLATANAEHGEFEAAVPLFREALVAKPDAVDVRCDLAHSLRQIGELEASLTEFEQVLKMQPGFLPAVAGQAETLESMGRRDDAWARLQDAIQAGPVTPEIILAYARLCRLMKHPEQAIPKLRQLLDQPDLQPRQRSRGHMLLGALLEDAGEYDDAFTCYTKGNENQERPFDAEALIAATENLVAFFTKERLASLPRSGSDSSLPVFIVGMPRSGTSLVEQILASHPKVFGAGERQDWGEIALGITNIVGGALGHFPQNVAALSANHLGVIAHNHLTQLQSLSTPATQITDKNPFNFMNLGLIQMIVPRARVIHCVRHPLDICVSCFSSQLSAKNNYANDLKSIAVMYREYHRLMEHWKTALSMPILEVRYEDTIDDLEGTVRGLLDFCGLEFDEACLRYYETKRHTRTASTDQVRQPIYRSSIERYRRFESHLDELRRDLATILD